MLMLPATSRAKQAGAAVGRMGLRGSTILIKFCVSLFLARYYELDVLGAYGLIAGLTAVVPVFLQMGVFNAVLRDSVTLSPQAFAQELNQYYVVMGLNYFVLAGAASVALPLFFPELSVGSSSLIVLIVMVEQLGIEAFSLLTYRGRLAAGLRVGLAQGLCWAVPLMVVSLLIPSARTLDTVLICWAAGAFVPIFWLLARLKAYIEPQYISAKSLQWFRGKARAYRSLYISDLTECAAQYVDRYIIGFAFGLSELGIYFLFIQASNAIFNLVNSGVIQSFRPSLIAAYFNRDHDSVTRVSSRLWRDTLGALAIMSVICGFTFPYVLSFVTPLGGSELLLWGILGAMICKVAYFLNIIDIYARREDRYLLICNMAVLFLVICISLAAVPFGNLLLFPLANGVAYLLVISAKSAATSGRAIA